KTLAEIEAIKVTDRYLDDSVDLKASVTIKVDEFKEVIVRAIKNAVATNGVSADDAISIGISTSISKSTDATADAEGLAQAYGTFAVTAINNDNRITGVVLDAYQSNVNFDATGTIKTDLTEEVSTKNQLKDAYNMRGASAIGKEWFEQAAAYAEFVTGMNKEDIDGIKVEKGYAAEEDLKASVTVHVTDFNTALVKALTSDMVANTRVAKFGMGTLILRDSSSSATADKNGTAQTDAAVAGVILDKEGKVVSVAIDVNQTKIAVSGDGKIATPFDTTFRTKYELKEDYNMKKFSAAKYEWYEQAESFMQYCIGKDLAEIESIKITDNYVDDSLVDLKASVTIHAGELKEVVVRAIKNAKDTRGVSVNDVVSIGISTSIAKSTDASADGDGLAQAYGTIAVLAVDENNKISAALLDAYQSNVNFDTKGVIKTDLTEEVATKNELKDAYNMRGASSIGKEWFEQAAAYADFAEGKDKTGIEGIKVEKGYAAEEDLKASVTVHVTDFNTALVKALTSDYIANARYSKFGYGTLILRTSSSSATAEKDGTAQTDAYIAGVILDKEGKIASIAIDANQTKISIDAKGTVLTAADSAFKTKYELKEDYNMKKFAGSQYEWYEQIESFMKYCIGKTPAQIEGIPVTDRYLDDSVDLKASVTIKVDEIKEVVLRAIANAVPVKGVSATDKVTIGVSTSISNSKSAGSEGDGLGQAYGTFAVLAVNENGKITGAYIDAYQSNVNFDTTGTIKTDLAEEVSTKNELKDGYNMRGASAIGKEWFEQAAAYAEFVVGKDKAGIEGIKVEKGYAAEEDLKASVTVHVTDFNKAIVNGLTSDYLTK
ncbi:MAG: hypothetical protein K6B75_04870, partial [Lachnospiraceae bacterium]|nr:hypothetical protein [Lachnospiraceae bacterium]